MICDVWTWNPQGLNKGGREGLPCRTRGGSTTLPSIEVGTFNCKNLIEYYAMGPCPAGWICVHQSGVWWISSYLPYCQGRSTVGVCNLKHPLVGIEVCGKNHERVLNWFIPVTGARMSDVKQQTTREILRATVGYRGNLLLIQFGSLNTEICVSRWKTGCFFSWGCCRVQAQQSKALQRWILEGLPLVP